MSRRELRILSFAGLLLVAAPGLAWAGMPSVTLTDVARLRLEGISFFLLGLLVSAGVVMAIWNWLARDFPRLPRLSYGKACGVVVLWGLLFVVVLTMISGARELLTPGAWEKTGLTYKLKQDDAADQQRRLAQWRERHAQLSGPLWLALAEHALAHEGKFPERLEDASADAAIWDVPGLAGTRYVYLPGRSRSGPPQPLAYEPEVFDGPHFVLLTSGRIEELPFGEILRRVENAP